METLTNISHKRHNILKYNRYMREKYFISSDIHGFYSEWIKALEKVEFDINNKLHKIIVCGDLMDRGNENIKCLEFVSKLIDEDRIICIKGNHEYLFDEIYKNKFFQERDYHNKTVNTYIELSLAISNTDQVKTESIIENGYNHPLYQKYKSHLIHYYETEKFVFVHGYIPCDNGVFNYTYKPNWRKSSDEEFKTASWLNPYEVWMNGVKIKDKTIVCGHFSTAYGHAHIHGKGIDYKDYYNFNDFIKHSKPIDGIFKDDGIIGLDATTALSHKVNVLVLSNGMKKIS